MACIQMLKQELVLLNICLLADVHNLHFKVKFSLLYCFAVFNLGFGTMCLQIFWYSCFLNLYVSNSIL